MYSIRKFSTIVLISSIIVFISLFSFHAYNRLNQSAELIIKNGRKELSMLSYTISKETTSYDDIKKFKALLDRTKASNDIIKAIFITDEQKILVTTDYRYNTIPETKKYYLSKHATALKIINKKNILHQHIGFYILNKRHTAHLFIVLNFEKINEYMTESILQFIYYIIILSSLYFLLLSYLYSKLLMKPLERLRQYAYYHDQIPKSFFFEELEEIRASMTQTFQNLEDEKKELHKLASTDPLSGLANRDYLRERLKWLIAESNRQGSEFALLFLDLDHFKSVNDSLGHQIGDKFLKKIALTLKEVVRANDIVARVGGDEFVIVISEYTSILKLTQIIKRIQTQIKQPHIIEHHVLELTSSLGIAFYPKDGLNVVNLMKNADIAMYQAKSSGRNQYHFFTEALNSKIQEEILLGREMKEGLKNKEFELHYQPQVNIKENRIIACEALVRWHHPKKGLIAPDIFIPLAEHSGFIVELGEWIMQEAMRQQVLWKEQNICDIPIAINISIKQLFHKDFEKIFLKTIEESNISTNKIDIEIVESMFLNNSTTSLHLLNMLHRIGATVSLDDFGTGYSSLSYLKQFPIDTLKIDKIFIDDFKSESGSIFLETIIKMGQTLKLKVLCEGVEREEQLNYLKKLHCDAYQGYLCAQPLNAKDFETFINSPR